MRSSLVNCAAPESTAAADNAPLSISSYFTSKSRAIKGIFNTTVPPFTPDGQIDFRALADAVERIIGFGYDGLLIGGPYGEFPTMPPSERAELLRHSIEFVGGRVPVMFCTAASD